jgi:preprotein translocase subunit SecD
MANCEIKKIAVIFLSSILLVGCHKPSASSVFQMRLVEENPSADSEEMILSNRDSQEKIYVQKFPLLDVTAVKSARITYESGPNLPAVQVLFTDSGAKQLAEITRQHIGDRLAIIVDGKLLIAPKIDAEISEGSADIAGRFSKSEVETLVKKINDAVAK